MQLKGMRTKIAYRLKSRWKGLMALALVIAVFIYSPFFQVVKSYSVMAVYSKMHEWESFLNEEGIVIKLPAGFSTLNKDYYPFVITYDTSDAFGRAYGHDLEMVVLYNFGAMEWMKGASIMYDVDSLFYSAFYGAYAARFNDLERQFGQSETGEVLLDELMAVTDYDLKTLVMKSVGNTTPEVDYEIINPETPKMVSIDGKDFLVYDAEIAMDGLMHEYEREYTAYIQYGRPTAYERSKNSFEKIGGYGRIYVYFDWDRDVSIIFYIIAPTKETVEYTEKRFILKSRLN